MKNGSGKLKDKVAVVTGSSKGIGAAIAREMAAEGASVVVDYASSKEDADRVVAAIRKAGGAAIAVKADVSKKKDIQKLFAAAEKEFGQIDVLVNNAGIYEFMALEDLTEEQFHKQFNLNVLGLLLATQEAVKHFSSAGGAVVNISSVSGIMPGAQTAVYGATKAAVIAITKSLSEELGPRGIRVNAISPGLVETEGTHAKGLSNPGDEDREEAEKKSPLGRIGQPRDVARAAVFLACEDSSWITGETLVVAGKPA